MRKRTFVLFGAFVAVFGVLIPLWAINSDGEEQLPTVTAERSAEGDETSTRELVVSFNENCGTCHTLGAAGADGKVGPNLDDLLGGAAPEANVGRVQNAIERGIAGRMPAGILRGDEAAEMAKFVAQVAGGSGSGAAAGP